MFTIIVATDKNMGIGKNGKMPWHIPEELKFFKETTLNHRIVIGRKTFEGVGVLPNRKTIVISRQTNLNYPEEVEICSNFDSFLQEHRNSSEEIFICGGAEIYRQALPYCNKIYLSIIDGEYEVDTYFPKFSQEEFQVKEIKTFKSFNVIEYQRKENGYEIC